MISEEQFDALAKISRFRAGSDNIRVSRLVLVDGMTTAQAAAAVQMTYNRAWTAVHIARNNLAICQKVAGLNTSLQ